MRLIPAIILGISAAGIGTAQAQYYQPPPPAYQVPNYQPPNTPPPGNIMSPFGGYGSNPTNPGNQLPIAPQAIWATLLSTTIKTIQEKVQAVAPQPSTDGCGARFLQREIGCAVELVEQLGAGDAVLDVIR